MRSMTAKEIFEAMEDDPVISPALPDEDADYDRYVGQQQENPRW